MWVLEDIRVVSYVRIVFDLMLIDWVMEVGRKCNPTSQIYLWISLKYGGSYKILSNLLIIASSSSSCPSSPPEEGGIKIFTVVLAAVVVVEEDVSSGSATGIPLDGLTSKPKAMSTNAAQRDGAAGRLIEKMKYFPDILSLAWNA